MSDLPAGLKTAIENYQAGKLEVACQQLVDYCQHNPANARLLCLASQLCYQTGRIEQSIGFLEQAREKSPGDSEIWFSLGGLYAGQNNIPAAISCYRESLRIAPDKAHVWSNLGVIYYRMQDYGASIECLTRAVTINSQDEKALFNLGLALIATGRVVEADRMFRAAREVAPDNEAIHSALLFNLNYLPGLTPMAVFDEHRRWGARLEEKVRPGENVPALSPEGRKLRIGYISPDFRQHSVFYFIAPVLRMHDRSTIECYGYSDVLQPDDATAQLQNATDHWRDVSRMTDEQLHRQIREDAIDILVDLAGHTAGNRLAVFAARAAPVQVSWLGYPGSTGLRQMDYRLTDERADPVAVADKLHTETLVRLEGGFLCYQPPAVTPFPGNTPALTNGFLTFGSFNNLAKVTDQVIVMWSDILKRVPGSKMVLKAKGLGDPATRERILGVFRGCGVDPGRVECLGYIGGVDNHLGQYNRIDIALDTTPYNGTTTTCEALWMGVPVVTIAGDRHVSRVGCSLLTAVGLEALVADCRDAYVDVAVVLAGSIERLQEIRSQMRGQVRTSPLMDASGFTRNLERHFRRLLAASVSG
jgi:protein O-GlcNAc transferase